MNHNKSYLIIDAHIHVHNCFNLEEFFIKAEINFTKAASQLSFEFSQAVLCLTESSGVDVFNSLKKYAEIKTSINEWTILKTQNSNALHFKKNNQSIFIIAGKQIVTKENVEVLAIGMEKSFPDGKDLADVIETCKKERIPKILPWGVGKWTGNRNVIITDMIKKIDPNSFYLGDNGNRPWFMKKSNLFKIAETRGIWNLPGSDPLPFDREIKKPGSFGAILEGQLDTNKPYDSLLNLLLKKKTQFRTYGYLESLIYFFKNQIAMQIVKRNRKK